MPKKKITQTKTTKTLGKNVVVMKLQFCIEY